MPSDVEHQHAGGAQLVGTLTSPDAVTVSDPHNGIHIAATGLTGRNPPESPCSWRSRRRQAAEPGGHRPGLQCTGRDAARGGERYGKALPVAKRSGRNRVLAFTDRTVVPETWLSRRGRQGFTALQSEEPHADTLTMLAEHPQRRHRLSILAQRFASLPRVAVVVLGLLLVLGIAYLDFTGPSKLVVSIFYLLPVMLVAWLSRSTICGLIVAAATFAADPVGNVLTDYRHSTLPLALWSGAMRFAVFCIVLALMAKVRSLLARLEEQATTDELTGLANLRAAHETMAREIERSKRFGHPLTLAYLDIDHFKEVNDRAGHAAGDRVLVGVASVARASTRAIDTVARVGGDEFVVLMPETGADTALPLVDRLREAFARAVRVEDQPLTCSIGLASFQRPPASVDEMMEAADRLMYEAKTAGGGDVCQREVRPVRSVTDRPQLASV